MIVDAGLLLKRKEGIENYYINSALMELFINHSTDSDDVVSIESVIV